jgi:hypothetical protein
LVKVMSWVSSMPSAVKTAGRTLKFPKLIAAEPEKWHRRNPQGLAKGRTIEASWLWFNLDPSWPFLTPENVWTIIDCIWLYSLTKEWPTLQRGPLRLKFRDHSAWLPASAPGNSPEGEFVDCTFWA